VEYGLYLTVLQCQKDILRNKGFDMYSVVIS
jgi:hypothetical protein